MDVLVDYKIDGFIKEGAEHQSAINYDFRVKGRTKHHLYHILNDEEQLKVTSFQVLAD